MRVGRGRKRNSLFNPELDDRVAWIKFVHGFSPAGGGKFDRETTRANEIQGFINDRADVTARAMTMDLDQVEMGQAIHQTGRGDLADAPKIVVVDLINAASDKLSRAVRNGVEHLVWIIEVMDRAEDEIEFVPILLDPLSSGSGSLRIVVQLDAGADLHVRIGSAQFFDLIKINAGVKTIVIGKCNVAQTALARAGDPRLQQIMRIRLNAMSLRMGMVIAEELIVDR